MAMMMTTAVGRKRRSSSWCYYATLRGLIMSMTLITALLHLPFEASNLKRVTAAVGPQELVDTDAPTPQSNLYNSISGSDKIQAATDSDTAATTNSTLPSKWPPYFRISGKVFGPTPLPYGQKYRTARKGVYFQPQYLCAGKHYDDFIDKAIQVAKYKTRTAHNNNKKNINDKAEAAATAEGGSYKGWGRRPTIVPTPSTTTRKILILGNSHARQVGQALEWQYQDQLVWPPKYLNTGENIRITRGSTAVEETFLFDSTNNNEPPTKVIIVHLYNHPCVYSQRWQQNLEEIILGHPLDELDAIVMGRFDQYKAFFRGGGTATATTGLADSWQQTIEAYQQAYPEQEVNMQENPLGFNFPQLAKAYDGPIISLSLFGNEVANQQLNQHRRYHIHSLSTASQGGGSTKGRNNLRMINARRYIKPFNLGECSSNAQGYVATCTNDQNAHRCMGNDGGLPDLVAWDLVETFYELLPPQPPEQQEQVKERAVAQGMMTRRSPFSPTASILQDKLWDKMLQMKDYNPAARRWW